MCYDWPKANYIKKSELIWIVKEIQPLYLSYTYLVRPMHQAFLNPWNEVHEHFCHKKLNVNQKREYGRVGSSPRGVKAEISTNGRIQEKTE